MSTLGQVSTVIYLGFSYNLHFLLSSFIHIIYLIYYVSTVTLYLELLSSLILDEIWFIFGSKFIYSIHEIKKNKTTMSTFDLESEYHPTGGGERSALLTTLSILGTKTMLFSLYSSNSKHQFWKSCNFKNSSKMFFLARAYVTWIM